MKIGNRVRVKSGLLNWSDREGTIKSTAVYAPFDWAVLLDGDSSETFFRSSELVVIAPVEPEKTKVNVEISMKMSLNYESLTDEQIDGLLWELMQEKVRRNNA